MFSSDILIGLRPGGGVPSVAAGQRESVRYRTKFFKRAQKIINFQAKMLVKYEPIQDRKRHEFKAKKSTQNLPNKWVRKHKFLIQRLSCLSGFLRYTLYCSGDESAGKTGSPAINTAVSGQWLLSVPDDCAKQSCSFHLWPRFSKTRSNLITQHSVGRVASKWCRLEGMKLAWGVKGTAERRSEESQES